MDNLSFDDFLVVGRKILCIGWCTLAIPAGGLHAEEPAGSKAPTERAEQADEGRPATTVELQKIQRLLKLLASRYPDRYGSVDPGRLDGVSGEETKIAIRNFRSIAHLPSGPTANSQLTADILSELASMSANAGSDLQARTEVDCAQTPEAAACNVAKPAASAIVAPAADDAKKDEVNAASAPAPAPTAATEPSKPEPAAQVLREDAKSAKPAAPAGRASAQVAELPAQADTKLYFVQAASLRSLAAAKREWAHIKEDNRAALQGEQVYFERADVKDRGIFYRILIGPEPNRNDANTLCAFLKQNGQSCVVTLRSSADIQRSAEGKRDDSQEEAVDSDSKAKEGSSPSATDMPEGGAIADPVMPTVAQPPAPPPHASSMQDGGMASPPAKPAATSVDRPINLTAPGANEPQAARPLAESTQPAISDTASSKTSGQPSIGDAAAPATAAASAAKSAAPGKAPAVIPANPMPAIPLKPEERNGPQAATAAAPITGIRNETSPSDHQRTETARGDQQHAYTRLADRVIAKSRSLANRLPNLEVFAILAAVLLFGAVLYRRHRRIRRAVFSTAVATNGFPLSDMNEGHTETGQTIATLEGDFESQQLRDSRRVRDEFLCSILDKNLENPVAPENQESAIRVNGSLKELLATNPAQYKSIFLNLIFLAKVGAALNRKEIALDQLNDQLSRELRLLRSYFKIHLLELDDRHRIRQELPGLFYCLQLTPLPNRAQGVHFSAA